MKEGVGESGKTGRGSRKIPEKRARERGGGIGTYPQKSHWQRL
jgi:hypothetical protein